MDGFSLLIKPIKEFPKQVLKCFYIIFVLLILEITYKKLYITFS